MSSTLPARPPPGPPGPSAAVAVGGPAGGTPSPPSTGADVRGETRCGQRRTAVVEDPDDVTVTDRARRGVPGMQPHRLPAGDLGRDADGADVELAVQPGRGLVRDEVQRIPDRLGS